MTNYKGCCYTSSMLKVQTLKNGLKVASYQIPQMRSVFVNLGVKAGSIFDTPQTSGAAHFMEHILLQAIPSFPNVEALSDYVESLAGSYNASTGPQAINFYGNLPASHLDDILKIASEAFYQPLFLDKDIERERGAVSEEIRGRLDQTWYKNWLFWSQARYRAGHPMLLSAGGSLEAVAKLKKKELTDYWKRFFDPKNSYLVVVGGFKPKDLKKALDQYFTPHLGKKAFEGFPKLTNADFKSSGVAIREDKELRSIYFDLDFPSLPASSSDQDLVTQTVIANVIGGLRSSRLYRLLRQRKGLVYHVNFSNSSYETFGFSGVELEVAPENLDEVTRLVTAELESFVRTGPTEEEVTFAKNYYSNRVLMHFDHPNGIAGWIQSDLMWNGRIYTPEQYAKLIQKVNKKMVMNLMKKFWDFDKLNLVLQGPIADSKENRQKFTEIISTIHA
jgi:predicted Zn-dependent peptidase